MKGHGEERHEKTRTLHYKVRKDTKRQGKTRKDTRKDAKRHEKTRKDIPRDIIQCE